MLKRQRLMGLMVAALCLQAGALLASEDTAVCRSDVARERAAVRDYLLARGVRPGGLMVTGGIKVRLNYGDAETQVGSFFNAYPQIVDDIGKLLQGNEVEMLILSGGDRVVPFTLMRWNDNSPDAGSVVGDWWTDDNWSQGWKLVFANLFLTRDLPQCSRLAVLVHDNEEFFDGNMFRLQTFPFASRTAETWLTEPVIYRVLSTHPPTPEWTLKFNRNIASSSFISWYVAAENGSVGSVTSFATEKETARLTLTTTPYSAWGGDSCMTLVVEITSPTVPGCRERDSAIGCLYKSPEIIATPFGNCD